MSLNENQPASKAGVEEQSLGITDAKADNVETSPQIALTLKTFPDAEGFWLLISDHRPHLYAKLVWVRQFDGDWRQQEKGGKWWSCRTGHWFQLPLDQLATLVMSEHDGGEHASEYSQSPAVAPSVVVGVEEKRWTRSFCDVLCNGEFLFEARNTGSAQFAVDAHNASLGEPREKEDLGEKEPPSDLTHVLQNAQLVVFAMEALTAIKEAAHSLAAGYPSQGGFSHDNYRMALRVLRLCLDYDKFVGASNAVLPPPVSESPVGSTATGVDDKARLDWLECKADFHDPENRMKVIFPIETVPYVTLRDTIDAAIAFETPVPSVSEPKELEEEKHD